MDLSHLRRPTKVRRAPRSGCQGEKWAFESTILPELWVQNADKFERARTLLRELRNLPARYWACPGCHEIIEELFEQRWNCGAGMPE